MSNFPGWPIFQCIPDNLLKNVTDALVVGNGVEECMIFVKESPDAVAVYMVKAQDKSCNKKDTLRGAKIKVISAAVSGHGTCLVLTNSGRFPQCNQLYNYQSQVGNGQRGRFAVSTPTTLRNQTLVKIAAGTDHIVCLTASAHVFAWGYNGHGQLGLPDTSTGTQGAPVAIDNDAIKSRKIIDIACTSHSSFALDDTGCLFGWGCNNNESPVLARTGDSYSTPTAIAVTSVFKGVILKQVVCGENYVLALTAAGTVFAWGRNDVGQLGTGDSNNVATPIEIPCFKSPRIRIKSLLAIHPYKISVACTIGGQIYIWGESRFGNMQTPVPVKGHSVHRALIDWAPKVASCHLNNELLAEPKWTKAPMWLHKSFDRADNADVKFLVEGRAINAHKSILINRSDYFAKMFSGEATWQEATSGQVEIQHCTYATYRALLYYLYTDDTSISEGLSKDELISLHGLAKCYLEDEMANKICDIIARKYLNVENCLSLYDLAAEHQMNGVASASMEFILDNLSALMNSPGFDEMKPVHVKEILRMCHARKMQP